MSESNAARSLRIRKTIAERAQSPDTEKMGDETQDSTYDNIPYPNHSDCPAPLAPGASAEETKAHLRILKSYTSEMLEAYRITALEGESLWLDFTTAFRPQTIRTWTRPEVAVWADFMTSRGVHVNEGRSRPKQNAIIDLLYREEHVPSSRILQLRVKHRRDVREEVAQEARQRKESKEESAQYPRKEGAKDEPSKETTKRSTAKGNDPDGDDSSSDDSEADERSAAQRSIRTDPSRPTSRSTGTAQRTLGINGLVKAFDKDDKYGGKYEQDLERAIRRFRTLTKMCNIPDDEKLQAIPVMLKDDALDYFDDYQDNCADHEEAFEMLRKWYHSSEQRARILTEWQQLRLSEEMAKQPEESEVSVFRNFVARLVTLQKQLDRKYQGDGYLVDRLLSAVDIPSIQASLKDRMPRKAQTAIHRISNRLSDKPHSAGASGAHAIAMTCDGRDGEAMYSLGTQFGGEAQKEKRPYRATRAKQAQERRRPIRQLRSEWMRGVRGCFVCGRDHRANDRNRREEVSQAIRKLKEKHPSALITIEDLNALYNQSDPDDEDAESGNDVKWADDESGDSDLAFLTIDQKEDLEERLAASAFLHGCSGEITSNSKFGNTTVFKRTNEITPSRKFEGVRIDTGANRRSVMSRTQYQAYTKAFGLTNVIRRTKGREVRGIGGVSTPL